MENLQGKKTWYFKGLTVTEEGRVYNIIGDEIVQKNGMFYFTADGKRQSMVASRLIYTATRGKIPRGYSVGFRDENEENLTPDNLYLKTRDTDKHKFTVKEVAQIRAEYQVLRAQKKQDKTFQSRNSGDIRKILADKHGCCPALIQRIIKGEYFNNYK